MSILDDLLARATPPLSAEQEAEALRSVQDPASPSATSAAAWDVLLTAHARAIRKASRVAADLDTEDAEAEALAAFCVVVLGVEVADIEAGAPLVAVALSSMTTAVADYARLTSAPVVVPPSVARRCAALLEASGGDLSVALDLARDGGHGVRPLTLLAAARGTSAPGPDVEAGLPSARSGEVDVAAVADLRRTASPEQQAVLDVAFGFDVEAITALREAGTLVAGNGSALASDRSVGEHLGIGRRAAQHRREAGLGRMRATLAKSAELDAAA